MKRATPTKGDLSGKRFGRLEIIRRSDKRGSRGSRTVPLWECRCDCGNITYKATDTLTSAALSMCKDCAVNYASNKMRSKLGYVDGTQITRIKSDKPISTNSSGCRGVYFDKRANKWRARLRLRGRLMSFGCFSSFEDAVAARKEAENEYFGEILDSYSKAESRAQNA